MKCIIVEDEIPAAKRLVRLLKGMNQSFEIVGILDTIEATVSWLKTSPHPDLIFMDIHLADGYAFEIFNQVEVESPVIFTTAYDEHALKAFEVNSIDYLLKPIDEGKLERSVQKLSKLKNDVSGIGQIDQLLRLFRSRENHKSRFLIKLPERLLTVDISQTAYFMASGKMVLLVTHESRHFPIDFTLDELENSVDQEKFFRINRQFISSFSAIKGIYPFFNGKLKIDLSPATKEPVFVSREKAGAFKEWLEGGKGEFKGGR
jgi:two-component system, LytTR family, response regulator LytT